MNIDFSNIKQYNGSQNSGFEELICQLAHLQKPDNGVTFIRKEGAGGDAGVECFWILENGDEYGWQAKYFTGEMTSSRWTQIDESVNAALEKHPHLTKYFVCMPLDRTDSRKMGRGGAKVVSILDEWNKRVDKWGKIAKEKERDIEFVYWGKHEILNFLTIDNPLYRGRALYWFDKPVLSSELFVRITDSAEKSLGERYTPEFHVDLPIAKKFNGLSMDPEWWDSLRFELNKLKEQRDQFFREFNVKEPRFLDVDKLKAFEEASRKLINVIHSSTENKYILDLMDEVIILCEETYSFQEQLLNDCEEALYEKNNSEPARIFNSYFYSISEYLSYLRSDQMRAAKKRAALLFGEAGIGKSHLLCDLSLHRAKQGLPTLFLLGQHFNGGNPLNFIAESLDLQHHKHDDVLGSLDAVGEACRTQALIIIDAINEGSQRDDWFRQIQKFLSELSRYKHISVLLSCRTTYLQHLIPEEARQESLISFEHHGFQGYEHRAAAKYLSMQGIVKPSAPILAPEFTNPLFLKTCCKALKANNLNAFPKGLHGFVSLFNFYVDSVEKVIAQRKKYNIAEGAVRNALVKFAGSLFPNNLEGLAYSEARQLINNCDPQPYKGDSLFDELMHENILSEDITYKNISVDGRGSPIIRFTYERFSDYFIAEQATANYTPENIGEIFNPEQPFGKILSGGLRYQYKGILEALSILIAEIFKLELIDILPKDAEIEDWEIGQIFYETIVWRSPDSITDKTREILNTLSGYGDSSPVVDVLLKVSTEPNHPWNAKYLHESLSKRELAERDYVWSIHLASSDQSEDDGGPESIVRTLIDWSCFGNLDDVEVERIELCATCLLWFLTSPNRRVRDQATKSLVRLIHLKPHLLKILLEEFHNVNDLYLVERLYAVAYGVICNINDQHVISEVSATVYKLVFADGNPIPHILLRDYARGILELAFNEQLLSNDIDTETFRPPYKSEWPLHNPSKEDIEKLEGDEYSSAIKSSLMGFPGDFGNYSMSCVHDWSSTPLSLKKPETGRELKHMFAEKYLTGELKKNYLDSIKPIKKSSSEDQVRIEIILSQMSDDDTADVRNAAQEERENLRKGIEEILNPEEKEYFRWLSGLADDSPAAFSRKWAQRWVCMRAHELGWKEKLFGNYERYCAHGRGSRISSYMERIGKKYQWIAFHEFLAHLSDNVHWIDRGYSDLDDKKYYGPWQVHERDIDPTIWIRKKAGEKESFYNVTPTWWQNYSFPLQDANDLAQKTKLLWSETLMPNFSDLLQITGNDGRTKWSVLRGFWSQRQKNDDNKVPNLDAWFRINSIIINKSDFSKLKEHLNGKNLCDPHTVNVSSTQHQGYFGEYPWHPYYQNISDCHNPGESYRDLIATKYLVPVSEYEWESGDVDYSLEQSISIYMPSKTLIQELDLSRSLDRVAEWCDNKGKVVFIDPSVDEEGPSYGLIDSNILQDWLNQNDKMLAWLIGGEKQLFGSFSHKFYGRLVFSGVFSLGGEGPVGELWFIKEPGREDDQ